MGDGSADFKGVALVAGRCLSAALALLSVALLHASCHTSASSHCGEVICPAGSQCVDDPDITCVLPDQLTACRGEPK